MYSDPQSIYFFTMSDSEIFLIKETEVEEHARKSSKVGVLKLKLPNEACVIASSSSTSPEGCDQHLGDRRDSRRDDGVTGKSYGNRHVTVESKLKQPGSPFLDDQVKVEDDGSGFRTPTSVEHKIEIKKCPPAPRKAKTSLKRKASQSHGSSIHRNPPLDLSKEVEFLFPSVPQSSGVDHRSSQCSPKKARKERI